MSQDHGNDRRKLLAAGATLLAGAVLGGRSQAASHSGQFYAVDAAQSQKCATCAFWGGMRKLSEDRKQVLTQSLGWCNNPKSRYHGKLTTPETGPMKSWAKWSLLE